MEALRVLFHNLTVDIRFLKVYRYLDTKIINFYRKFRTEIINCFLFLSLVKLLIEF